MRPLVKLWNEPEGREIDMTPLPDRAEPKRIVACLNVWNDHSTLEMTVPSWKHMVDHVIVVDGSYSTTGLTSLSTDGTRQYLESVFPSIEFVDGAGLSQCEKRTAYLDRGQPGDYLVIIDADERVVGDLRDLPECDIGWVRVQSTLYVKEYGQPRVIRWRPGLEYKGRHHWMYYAGRLFCTHQYSGPGFSNRPVAVTFVNDRELGRSSSRRAVKAMNLLNQNSTEFSQYATERSRMSDMATRARECLHILNYVYRDDGFAPSRLHTSINRTTPHSSVFFKVKLGPFGVHTQYDAGMDYKLLAKAEVQADVIHIHSPVSTLFPSRFNVPIVLHHHGTRLRVNPKKWADEAKRRDALVIVANLELLTWAEGAVYLPNAVPVSRYLALANQHRTTLDRTFRIAHSPTMRERKGTTEFLMVCDHLRQRGYPVEPVLIEKLDHTQALMVKATCHAVFDSFWLGMQCSGIEGAAMGMPVVAGDAEVAKRYREHFGVVPYTYADSAEELEVQLARLMDDPHFYFTETTRVHNFIVNHHDESAVALTYLNYLDEAFHWRAAQVRSARRVLQAR